MVIEMEAYQVIGLALTIGGSIFGAGKAFFGRMEASIHERDNSLENAIRGLSDKMDRQDSSIREIEKDILKLKADLPREYVAKEDFVRSFTVVEAKLDAVQTLITNLKTEGKN